MSFQRQEEKKKSDPLQPLLGFILLIVIGGLSYLASPFVLNWLQTTNLSLGMLGPILPMTLPPEWPEIVKQGLVTVLLFMVGFTVAMIVLFSITKPPKGETDVSMAEVRARKGTKRR